MRASATKPCPVIAIPHVTMPTCLSYTVGAPCSCLHPGYPQRWVTNDCGKEESPFLVRCSCEEFIAQTEEGGSTSLSFTNNNLCVSRRARRYFRSHIFPQIKLSKASKLFLMRANKLAAHDNDIYFRLLPCESAVQVHRSRIHISPRLFPIPIFSTWFQEMRAHFKPSTVSSVLRYVLKLTKKLTLADFGCCNTIPSKCTSPIVRGTVLGIATGTCWQSALQSNFLYCSWTCRLLPRNLSVLGRSSHHSASQY